MLRLVRSLHSPGAVLLNISHEQRIIQLGFLLIAHNTTNFATHMPIILVRGTNLYLPKFWPQTPKNLQVQICSPGTGLFRYGWQTQLYYALFVGNVKQDSPWWVQRAHKSCGDCFHRTRFCIWVKETLTLAEEAVFAKVTIILAPLYGPTVLVLPYAKTKLLEVFSGPLWIMYINLCIIKYLFINPPLITRVVMQVYVYSVRIPIEPLMYIVCTYDYGILNMYVTYINL